MSLNRNMGTIDRIVRVSLAVIFAALILTGAVSGAVAVVLGVLGAVFLSTSVVQFCPLYLPFKLSTRGKEA